ncbi:MAG: hypothetical protein WCR95_04175 [Eubacteriales bacterium]
MEDKSNDNNQYQYDNDQIKQAETMRQTDEKCPSCGGAMDFDPKTGMLLCMYCGAVKDFEGDNPEIAMEIDFDLAEDFGSHDWGKEKKSVVCRSCGGESIYDALEISDICPYCGSPLVAEAGYVDAMAPGGVCGFSVSLKDAAAKFKKWIKRRFFAPKAVKKFAEPESFKGVYLPFWTFDTQTTANYTARYGIDRTVTVNGKPRTTTSWYRTSGVYEKAFDDLLVSGTTRYEEKLLSKIEPFNTSQSRVYKPEYIAGFIAERYSVGLNDAWVCGRGKIKKNLEDSIKSHIKRTKHCNKVQSLKFSVNYSELKFKYLLLPVWMSSFRYKDKIYNFLVNGQTGKVGGKTPVSPLRVAVTAIIAAAALFALYYLFTHIRPDIFGEPFYYTVF